MNPGGEYGASARPVGAAPESAKESKGSKTKAKKAAEKPAEKKEPKKEAEKEYVTEPLVTVGDGKIHLVLNYPLTVMICFMVVVAVICAVLVGWKLGRDGAYRELLLGQQERIEQKTAGTGLEEAVDGLGE